MTNWDRPRCGTCQWWDDTVQLTEPADRINMAQKAVPGTGRCIAYLPAIDGRTGRGLWPFTDSRDGCGRHSDIRPALPNLPGEGRS